MNVDVRPDDIGYEAAAFDHVAENIDTVIGRLARRALDAYTFDGSELRLAEAAFEDLWRRRASDMAALAASLRHLAATVRNAGSLYQATDGDAAATFDAHDHGVQSP